MRDFPRIRRLPPYVFNITDELKMASRRGHTQGNSVSKGVPRLRRAIRGVNDMFKHDRLMPQGAA